MSTISTGRAVYLSAAEDAAWWIRSTGTATEHGLVWRPDPDQPERDATLSAPNTIYSGNAGIVLFLLELADATGDERYAKDALRGADQLAETWREVLEFKSFFPQPNSALEMHTGLSGT